jgi:hypothetical protein
LNTFKFIFFLFHSKKANVCFKQKDRWKVIVVTKQKQHQLTQKQTKQNKNITHTTPNYTSTHIFMPPLTSKRKRATSPAPADSAQRVLLDASDAFRSSPSASSKEQHPSAPKKKETSRHQNPPRQRLIFDGVVIDMRKRCCKITPAIEVDDSDEPYSNSDKSDSSENSLFSLASLSDSNRRKQKNGKKKALTKGRHRPRESKPKRECGSQNLPIFRL